MNNFGERQHPEKYVPMVMKKILHKETIEVHGKEWGDGDWDIGARVWLHARNHADAVQYILENVPVLHYDDDTPEPERFNIAGEKEINNLEIVEMIAEIFEMYPYYKLVDFHSSRPGHDLRYSLDGTKLREHGWNAPMTLEESFERTVNWTLNHPEWLTE
jgi:dTDP-glucose 4,6-dehydratase